MATTTNYGWTTPDDTALVKDGASAIRTLGTSVDTTTKNLNPSTTLGDVEYRSSTSNTNTRLGIGSTGQVLTVAAGVPSWATPSSGGMTLISTTTLTGASVTLSSIPATYKNLQLVIRKFVPATDSSNLNMRVNGDSATRYLTFSAFSTTAAEAFNQTQVRATTAADNAVSESLAIIEIPDYTNTTTFKILQTMQFANDFTTTTSVRGYFGYSVYNQTPAISSITFLCDSGNITSGTVLLYGVS